MLKLFLHWFNFRHHRAAPGFDVHSFVDLAADLGFSGVNICVFPPSFPFLGSDAPEHLDALRRHLDARGLLIDLETRGTDPAHLTRLLEIGRRLGAGHLRTYTLRADDPREQVLKAVRDLAQMGPLAERAGIPILAENHEDLTATEVVEILQRVDHPWIRALFDYGNSMVYLEEPAESVRLLAPFARTAHLKDHVVLPAGAAGPEPLFMGVPLGEGNLPIVATTRALIAAGTRRICFENCWAYHTRFRDRRGQGVLGEGAFAYRQPPYDPRVCLPDPEATARAQGLDLVALERETVMDSIRWLARTLREEGIALERELTPPPAAAG